MSSILHALPLELLNGLDDPINYAKLQERYEDNMFAHRLATSKSGHKCETSVQF